MAEGDGTIRASGLARSQPGPIRNVLSNWSVFVFSMVANFFLAPFIVHSLGNAAYGAWVLLGSTVGYLGLLDLGVRSAVTRFVSKLHAAADHEGASRFASAGLFLFSLTSAIAVLTGLGLAAVLGRLFEIPPVLLPEARVAVVLIACTIALALLGGVYGGVITAMQRFDLASATEIVVQVVRITAVVIALRSGEGLVALAAIQLGCGLLQFAIAFALSRRLYPQLRVGRGGWGRAELRQVLGFSMASTALQGAGMVILELDGIVIGAFLSVAMITYFSIAGTLSQYGKALVSGISYTVPARVSAQQGRGDMSGARRTALLGGRVASLVHMPIVATFLIRGGTFIGLWMGAGYVELSGRVLVVLSLAYWFFAGRQIMVVTLMGLNRHRSLIPVMWVEALLNLGLSVALIRPLGVVGVALGTTVPALLLMPTAYLWLFGRVLSLPPARVGREIWLRPSLAMLPFLVASLVFERLTTPTSLIAFFAQVAAVLPAAAAGAWWIGLGRDERLAILRLVPPRFRRLTTFSGSWSGAAADD